MKTVLLGDQQAACECTSTVGGYFSDLALSLSKTSPDLQCVTPPGGAAHQMPALRNFDVLRARGIACQVAPAPAFSSVKAAHGQTVRAAYEAYEFLKNKTDVDVVHFVGDETMPYYYLTAKRLGLLTNPPHVVLHVVTPFLYKLTSGQRQMSSYAELGTCFMERRSIEMADTLIAQSDVIAKWMNRFGYADASRVKIAPGLAFVPRLPRLGAGQRAPIERLVFAGRLTDAKGLATFVYALNTLTQQNIVPKKVMFLGGEDPDFPARSFIEDAAKHWRFEVVINTNLSRQEFLVELARPKTLVVVPSLVDERPLVVQECVALQTPFIAADVGDIRALTPDSIADAALIPPHHQDLAKRLTPWLAEGAPESYVWPVPAPVGANAEAWRTIISDIEKAAAARAPQSPATISVTEGPLVSVCVAHYNRPQVLRYELESIESQTYRNFEVVVVDDGSTPENVAQLKEVLKEFPHARLVLQENRYLGAARNTGARNARGEYLLFKDDDNIAKPNEIETFVAVAERNKSDVIVAFSDNFGGEEEASEDRLTGVRRISIGQDLAYGFFRNGYGDSNCFVRRSVWETLGGFTEHYRIGLDDHEFFTRATLRGYRIDLIPEALYYYRTGSPKMKRYHIAKHANFNRIVTPYLNEAGAPPHLVPLIFAARGYFERAEIEKGQKGGARNKA